MDKLVRRVELICNSCPSGHRQADRGQEHYCPKQGQEGAPDVWLEIDAAYAEAIDGLKVG